jgi:GTP-binding protein
LVLFLLDMSVGVVREDMSIGSLLEENAKSLIVLLNKCDLIQSEDRENYLQAVKRTLYFLDFAPFMFTSGTTGENLDKVFKKIKKIVSVYKTPLKKSELEEALKEIKTRRSPRRGTRIYDLKQDHLNPNTIILRTNNAMSINSTYQKFIKNYLHKKFGMEGIPLQIKMRNTSFRREGG